VPLSKRLRTSMVAPVTSGSPTGTVSFLNGTKVLGTSTVVGGTASIATVLAPGNDLLTASISGETTEAVIPSGFSLALTSSSLTVPVGSSGTDTLTVAATGGYTGTLNLQCMGLPADTYRAKFAILA
jgi:hypothetical protein